MCKDREINELQEMYDQYLEELTEDVLETVKQAVSEGVDICLHCLIKDALTEAFNDGIYEGKMIVLDIASESIGAVKEALIESEEEFEE